jgi:carbamoyl-phosphate synthase large subunit
MNVLTEASGGVASMFIVRAIQQAGHRAIASDISQENSGSLLADAYIQFPSINAASLWTQVIALIKQHNVQVVIPSLDDMLLGWDEHRRLLDELGITLILSPKATLDVCLDKWLTYQFFCEIGVPTPQSSLEAIYPLIKPRHGRGAKGIVYLSQTQRLDYDMSEQLSQHYLSGVEYTIDVLCNQVGEPVYIIPRSRDKILNGKAVDAQVVYDEVMIDWVKLICTNLLFVGAINIQCFKEASGDIFFTEINPRLASGMALSFAASENWFGAMINNHIHTMPIIPTDVLWGLKMYRYYQEVFT